MKKDIHPEYHTDAKIKCVCGAILETGSTHKELEVEICSSCHPFYTGKQKVVDSTGRVDRFKKITEKSAKKKEESKKTKATKKKKTAKKATVKKTTKKVTKKTK